MILYNETRGNLKTTERRFGEFCSLPFKQCICWTSKSGGCLSLLAKINLALGDFDAAIEAANKVINDGVHYLMTDRFGVDKMILLKCYLGFTSI